MILNPHKALKEDLELKRETLTNEGFIIYVERPVEQKHKLECKPLWWLRSEVSDVLSFPR